MSELKPCPFCGGKAELVNYGLTGRLKIVQCLDCGARTRTFDPEVKRGKNAIEAWNRRVPISSAQPDPLSDIDRMKYYVCCPMCDLPKCVKGTVQCEAEQWAQARRKEGEQDG